MLNFINTLTWWQWTILAMVPPAIVALYFLKLKRRPVEVPSTYLWKRSIEDLHVNSIWQRLKNNLLLLLQLLVLLLAAFALLRPHWRGEELIGNRFVLLVDNSASMQATDVAPSRLDEAKRQALEVIDQMESGDSAMVVSFSDAAGTRVEQTFTDNRAELARAIESIQPTPRRTDIIEALRVAAGLANPGRSSSDITDYQVAEARPATLLIFSDGCFDEVQGFELGNLEPVYHPIGDPKPANVGIAAFSVGKNEVQPQRLQAFARLENSGPEDVDVSVEMLLDGVLKNYDTLRVPAGEGRGVAFPLTPIDSGVLHLKVKTRDHLAVDDEAWCPVNRPRRAKVLVVTAGNEKLLGALTTQAAADLAEVTVESPAYLATPEYEALASSRSLDVIVYDRCQPEEMPQANTWFIGAVPPPPKPPPGQEGAKVEPDADADEPDGAVRWWKAGESVVLPGIIDTDISHPLMRWLDLGNVRIAEGTPLEYPPGGSVLIDTDAGPMLVIAPREGFEDAVLGFLVAVYQQRDEEGSYQGLLGWPIRASFPAFVMNLLQYFGDRQLGQGGGTVLPGGTVRLDSLAGGAEISVRAPDGETVKLAEQSGARISFADTDALGVYEVLRGGDVVERFAVNLTHPSESDIAPRQTVQLGFEKVEGQSAWETVRRELWKLLLAGGLVVLVVEWYIYNRRVWI